MAIPNVKRFRPFCPTCNDSFTLMAVLPREADVDKYLADAVSKQRPNYQIAQTNMKQICNQCHSKTLIDRVYQQAEDVVTTTNTKGF